MRSGLVALVLATLVGAGAPSLPDRSAAIRDGLEAFPMLSAHAGRGHRLEATAHGYRLRDARSGFDVTLPARADGPVRIAAAEDDAFWIEIAAAHARPQHGLPVEGALTFGDVADATDAILVAEPGRFEETRILRSPRAPTTTSYRLVVGPAVGSLYLSAARGLVAVDAKGQARLEMGAVFAVDARGVRRNPATRLEAEASVWQLIVELDPSGLEFPIAIDPVWTSARPMSKARSRHVAVPLVDGRVLVAGGGDLTLELKDCEAYEEKANTWSAAGSMSEARLSPGATRLSDGRVLVSGGGGSQRIGAGYTESRLSTAEVFEPGTNAWTTLASMSVPRVYHTSTLLADGRVLVAGGTGLSSAELYDPGTKAWAAAAPMKEVRAQHVGIALKGGGVLVAGGASSPSAEVYDPIGNTWKSTNSMKELRAGAAAVSMPDGRVLVSGGMGKAALSSVELYDPKSDAWSVVGFMKGARTGHATALLGNGKVLVAGGEATTATELRHKMPEAELYDATADQWTLTDPLAKGRSLHTATALPSGRVLVAGGEFVGNLSLADLFALGATGAACAAPADCFSSICAGKVCADTCTRDDDCAAEYYCDGARCALRRGIGGVCTSASECVTAYCVSGACCDKACFPRGCSGATCKTTCGADADCAEGYGCRAGDCVSKKAVYSADGGSVLTPTGEARLCAPYLCRDGACLPRCASQLDCAATMVCTSEGECAAPSPAPTADAGACGVQRGAPGDGPSIALGALLLASIVSRRRRRS